ncbi:hypothetical protein [Glutamicibacter sp.]|uniref:hypothetical protein n=1 Tax=Glutamicibacter sp. TaxID=1931995 RepID=UPI002B47A53D|nr:hypothetical protein [Glutamicibacter sp.]HJX77290.1 hypothetical protein [Glutamicibacter sp.]
MTYRIEESPLGTYALMLGQMLIMQAGNPDNPELAYAECVRVRDVLDDCQHAERVLANTYYDRDTNQIKDGIPAR